MHYGRLTCPDGITLRYGETRPAGGGAPTALVLQGRAECMEKYRETIGELSRRGYRVVSFDWRGQGGSDRLLADRQKGHIDDFDRYLDDLGAVIAAKADPEGSGIALILAHSTGAQLALRYLQHHPGRIANTLLTAPFLGLAITPALRPLLTILRRLYRWSGRNRAYAPGNGPYDPAAIRFDGNPLTSDTGRFARNFGFLADHPELRIGGPTMGWIDAAFRSIDRFWHDLDRGAVISDRVALFIAGADRVVDNRALYRLARRLPQMQVTTIPGARHEILQETDALRAAFWRDADAFLAAADAPGSGHAERAFVEL